MLIENDWELILMNNLLKIAEYTSSKLDNYQYAIGNCSFATRVS